MKYRIVLLVTMLFSMNAFTQNGLSETFYSNGNTEYSCNYKNGKKHGKEKKWDSNGILEYSCEYKNGKRDGIETGKRKYDSVSAKDLQGNRLLGWYPLYKNYETHYINGKKDGLHQEWYVFSEAVIINDSESNRRDINLLQYNGNLSIKCSYKEGRKSGLEEIYLRNGNLLSRSYYLNGQKDGLHQKYYTGNKDNPDRYYLAHTCDYQNGEKHGAYTTFWKSGAIRYIWTYSNGDRVGDTKYVNKYER